MILTRLFRLLVLAVALPLLWANLAHGQPNDGLPAPKPKKTGTSALTFRGDIANLVPEAPTPNAAKLVPPDGVVTKLDPALVRFTQETCSPNFSDNRTVADLIAALEARRTDADRIPPLRIFEHNGAIWSLDNRRLYAFKTVGLPVRVVRATPAEISKESYKFSTRTHGTTILIRTRREALAALEAEEKAARDKAARDKARTSPLPDALRHRATTSGAGTGTSAGLLDVLRRRVTESGSKDRDRVR